MARAGGWLVGARRVRAAMMLLLLTMMLMPQKAAANDDYESGYSGRDFSLNWDGSTPYVLFRVTYWDDYGTDEGWCTGDGLVVKASKDGGNNYDVIGKIKTSSSGGLTMSGSISNAWNESTKYTKICIPKWVLPRQWRNCNAKAPGLTTTEKAMVLNPHLGVSHARMDILSAKSIGTQTTPWPQTAR